MASKPLFSLLFVFLLLISPPLSHSHPFTTLYILHSLSHSHSFSFSTLQTLHSLSHSLLLRVATLRSSRGDTAGSTRARLLAANLHRTNELVGDLNELLRSLNELTQMSSKAKRAEWVARNYRIASRSLLKVFLKSGSLKQLVETVQKEAVEGDLLRDCLELGSNDLNGLVQILKDVALQFSSNFESDL